MKDRTKVQELVTDCNGHVYEFFTRFGNRYLRNYRNVLEVLPYKPLSKCYIIPWDDFGDEAFDVVERLTGVPVTLVKKSIGSRDYYVREEEQENPSVWFITEDICEQFLWASDRAIMGKVVPADPQLTGDVFHSITVTSDIHFAAVNRDGVVHLFRKEPVLCEDSGEWRELNVVEGIQQLGGEGTLYAAGYDASDWQHSLVERLPD